MKKISLYLALLLCFLVISTVSVSATSRTTVALGTGNVYIPGLNIDFDVKGYVCYYDDTSTTQLHLYSLSEWIYNNNTTREIDTVEFSARDGAQTHVVSNAGLWNSVMAYTSLQNPIQPGYNARIEFKPSDVDSNTYFNKNDTDACAVTYISCAASSGVASGTWESFWYATTRTDFFN